MSNLLAPWLEAGKQPAHFYELLGLPPFYSQNAEAAQRIRNLSREVLGLPVLNKAGLVAEAA